MNTREMNIRRAARQLHKARKRFQKAVRRALPAQTNMARSIKLGWNVVDAQVKLRMSAHRYAVIVSAPIPVFPLGASGLGIATVGDEGLRQEMLRLPNSANIRAWDLSVGNYIIPIGVKGHNIIPDINIAQAPNEDV